MRPRTALLWLTICSLSFAALMGIAALLLPQFQQWGEHILITSLIVGGFSLACLVCAIVLGKRKLIPLMWAGMAASLIAVIAWLFVVWNPYTNVLDSVTWYAIKIAGEFTTISVFAVIIGLLSLPNVRQHRLRITRNFSYGLLATLALFIMCHIWMEYDNNWVFQVFGSFSVVIAWNIWIALLLKLRLDRIWHQRIRWITLAIGFLFIVWLILFIWELVNPIFSLTWNWAERINGVFAILTACGTVVIPILALIEMISRKGSVESIPIKLDVKVTCPRCNLEQTLKTGPSKCKACNLRITINIEEPRCECGYLLYKLTSSDCPECGREIPETERWQGHKEGNHH